MAPPAEQGGDGHAEILAGQIPERDVDAGKGVDIITAEEAADPHEVVEILVDHDRIRQDRAR